MTNTTYMGRDPRRDHGFHVPDPQLTKEHGTQYFFMTLKGFLINQYFNRINIIY